ncbi:MAG: MFS transporter [Planctomycetota bacterium]
MTAEPAPAETTPADERIPLHTKVAAGAGEGAINIGVNIPPNFSFLVYNLGLAVSPTLLGVALFIPRIWDAVIDPVMGSVSDNSTSKWGRRKPFMLIGALLSIAGIFAICYVPGGIDNQSWSNTEWGPVLNFGFATLDLNVPLRDWAYAGILTFVCIIFYTCLTVFAVPYGALTMELTSDYEERTRVMSFRTLFTYLTGFFLAWLYPIVKASEDTRTGAIVVGSILAVLLAVIMFAPTFFVPERTKRREAGGGLEDVRKQPKVGIWKSIVTTIKQPILLMIVAAYTIGFLGVIMVLKLGLYVAIFHVYGGGEQGETDGAYMQGWAQTFAIIMGLITVLIINRLATKVEKKWLLIGALMSSFIGGLLSWWLYSPDFGTFKQIIPLFGDFGNESWYFWLPDRINFWFHPLAISFALIWPGLAGLLIMSNSMIADVCDLDELKTGQRREGSYWAVFNWIQKMAIGVALLFSGAILDLVGYVSEAGVKTQTLDVINNMRWAYMLVVCGGVGLAAVIVLFIPLNKQRMENVRVELEAKRAANDV